MKETASVPGITIFQHTQELSPQSGSISELYILIILYSSMKKKLRKMSQRIEKGTAMNILSIFYNYKMFNNKECENLEWSRCIIYIDTVKSYFRLPEMSQHLYSGIYNFLMRVAYSLWYLVEIDSSGQYQYLIGQLTNSLVFI